MAEQKDFLDYEGLVSYDHNIKEYVKNANKNANIILSGYTPSIYLGSSYTEELKEDISSGNFQKAIVGGYLTLNGHIYDFAHPDYWLHTGDTECTTHHMVVVPRVPLINGHMNKTNITTNGYGECDFRTGANSNTALSEIRAIIEEDFGAENILNHRMTFTNGIDSKGLANNWKYYDSDIDLMSEIMVYGTNIVDMTYGCSGAMYETGFDKTQLKLFKERPDLITTRTIYFLRSIKGAGVFCLVNLHGLPNFGNASENFGIRPVFAIK